MDCYSYIVRHDSGFAPNPFGGACTLACCKPKIRKTAKLNDWILGTASAPHDGRLIYAMRVDRSLTFDMYFKDPAYASKKPGPGNPCGDNIYEPRTDRGFRQLPNPAHDQRSVAHDLSTNRVLISSHFYYFGGQGPRIPADFADVVHTTQGHLRIRGDRDDARYRSLLGLLSWLEHHPLGVSGEPTEDEVICVFPEDEGDE